MLFRDARRHSDGGESKATSAGGVRVGSGGGEKSAPATGRMKHTPAAGQMMGACEDLRRGCAGVALASPLEHSSLPGKQRVQGGEDDR